MPPKNRKMVVVEADTQADARRRALAENPGWTITGVGAPRKRYAVRLKKKKRPERRKK